MIQINPPYKRTLLQRVLRIIALCLAVLMALVVALFIYMTTPYFAAALGGWITNASGRNVAMEGSIEMHLLQREPQFIFRGIKIGNADWAKSPSMFEAERIEVSLRLSELLHARIVLPELIIDQPKIAFEKNEQGAANWEFTQNPQSAAVKDPVPDSRGSIPVIGHLQITDGVMSYHDPKEHIDTTLKIATISGSADKHEALQLSGDGSYQNQPFKIDVSGASILELRETSQPYPFHLKTVVGNTSAEVTGTVQDPVKMEAVDVTLKLKGANAADLFPLTGIALPPTPDYEVQGHLVRNGADWDFQDFKGRMGDSDLQGHVVWHSQQKPPYFEGSFVSNNLDMKDLAGFVGAHKGTREETRVIPDAPLDISRMMAMNADVEFRGKKVKAPDLLDDFYMNVSLKDGTLTLRPVSFGIAKGTIIANVTVEGKANPPPVDMVVSFNKLSLNDLFRPLVEQYGDKNVSAGLVGGKATLKGHGKSLREMLAASNGTIGLGVEGGNLSRLMLELVGLDLFRSAGLLIGGDEPVAINCIIADFGVENGVMYTQEMLVDTDVTTIRGKGQIDFKDEAVDLKLRVIPRDNTLVSARSPITVTGTLKNPSIGVEPTALAVRGGVATALALLAPPAVLLAFIEPSMGEESHCAAVIRKMQKDTGAKPPKASKAVPAKKAIKAVKARPAAKPLPAMPELTQEKAKNATPHQSAQ